MNPNTPDFHEIVLEHAGENLFPARDAASNDEELDAAYHAFLKLERCRIKDAHKEGASGLEVAAWRSALTDVVINDHYAVNGKKSGKCPYTLVASGGYGRGLLNPGSDIDIQFILHRPANGKTLKSIEESIRKLLTMLYDAGFSVGHGVRTIKEATRFANQDHPTKTAFLDARVIAGDGEIFDGFEAAFSKSASWERNTNT